MHSESGLTWAYITQFITLRNPCGSVLFLVNVSVCLSVCRSVRIFLSSLAFELLHKQTLYFLRSSSVQKSRRGLYLGSGEALLTEFQVIILLPSGKRGNGSCNMGWKSELAYICMYVCMYVYVCYAQECNNYNARRYVTYRNCKHVADRRH